ncbi:spore germination protein, partial [Pseudomonas sp. FW305-BF6]|uniref:spore germination protein n=1 Tax=Pseudomonas sp. FW305-BF6 TaxID=2070673 RepID=UPI00156FEFB7
IKSDVLETQIIQQIIHNPKETIEETVSIKEINTSSSFDESVVALVKGNAVIFTDNRTTAIILNIALLESRSIEQPDTEQVLRGAQDGFIESLETNINLLRRRINNPNLVIKYVTLGRESDTSLAIVYV